MARCVAVLTAYRRTLVGREEKDHTAISWASSVIPSHPSLCASDLGRCCSASEVKGWLHDAVMEWSFVVMQLFQGITPAPGTNLSPGLYTCQFSKLEFGELLCLMPDLG